MEIRKILEKELSKSGGRAELVKVPPERRPSKESLDRLNRDVEGLVRMTGNQVDMYISYSDLVKTGIFIVALIGLCYTIFKGKKK